MKRKLLIGSLLVFFSINLAGQEITCNSFWSNIATYYNDGDYLTIIENADSLLNKCTYSKEDKVLIYKYAIAAEKAMGLDSMANVHTKQLLKLSPFYKYNRSTDPPQLEDILLKYKTFPRISMGYYASLNKLLVDRVVMYQILDSMDYTGPYYSTPSVSSALFFNYNINDFFTVGLSGGVFYSNFSRELDAYNFLSVNYKERFSGIRANFYFINKLNFLRFQNITPYIKYGTHLEYNTRIRYEIQMSVYDANQYQDFTLPQVYEKHDDLPLSTRRKWRFGLDAGGGFIYDMQKIDLFVEAYYMHDLVNYTLSDSRIIPDLAYNFYYINDDILLNKVQVMIGFSLNFKYTVKAIY